MISFGSVLIISQYGDSSYGSEMTSSTKAVAMIAAFALGVGDAGVVVLIYTVITQIWYHDTPSAFALMKEMGLY